jgi:hypothetical protein
MNAKPIFAVYHLSLNPATAWEGEEPDFPTATRHAFQTSTAYGFSYKILGGVDELPEILIYFGEVLPLEDAARAATMLRFLRKGDRDEAIERMIAENKAQRITHFVKTRSGNFCPLTHQTVVYDAATGTNLLWPQPQLTPQAAPKPQP